MKIRSLILASILALSPVWAYGQTANGKVTTAAPTYTNNQAAPLSLDTSGNLRVTGSFTPPSVQNVQGVNTDGSTSTANPVNIGGVYVNSSPSFTNGMVGNVRINSAGFLAQTPLATQVILTDGSNNFSSTPQGMDSVTSSTLNLFQISKPYVFNGTTWDRTRGDVNGSWVQGNVASGVADAGNPVKIGGIALSGTPTIVTNGQRTDAAFGTNGSFLIGVPTASASDGTPNVVGAVFGQNTTGGAKLQVSPSVYNGSTWDRQRGDVNGTWVVPSASSSGTSNFSAILANSTNSTLVKNAAGIITEISVYNSGSTIAWLKLYNAASAPTCGSGTPVGRYMIPGAASGGAGSNVSIDLGKAFSTGIAFCVTTGIADSDTTAVAASTYTVNMTYK